MKARSLVGIAIAIAAAVAACDDGSSLLDGAPAPGENGGGDTLPGDDDGTSTPGGPSATVPDDSPSGPVPTNSPEGKAFYKANVHPVLAQKCGACHAANGPGPHWLTPTDSEKSYGQLFSQGYVVPSSRMVTKPAHGGVTTSVLSNDEAQLYNQWVTMELEDGGDEAPPNVLEKLGSCFDRDKFDAMKLGEWRTTRRRSSNNVNDVKPWNENANTCTGCNNVPCSTCHSADPATNFINAVGNPILPQDTTFESSKMTAPAYITKYFGVSPDGKPVPSEGIKKKSEATMKDKAYTHPMYRLTESQQKALDEFVNDVITKYNAGLCGN